MIPVFRANSGWRFLVQNGKNNGFTKMSVELWKSYIMIYMDIFFLNIFRMRTVKKNGTKLCILWIQKLHNSQWQPTWKVCYVRAFQYLKEVPFGKPLLITSWIWRMINLKRIITKNCWPIIIQVEILHRRPNRYR